MDRTLSKPRPRTELIAAFKARMAGYADGFFISQEDRDKAAKSGAAMPDGSYPILTCNGDNSVDTAVNAVGRGQGGHDAIRKHIMTRAESLGCPDGMIPDNWNSDGSLKASAPSDAWRAAYFARTGARFADVAPATAGDVAADDEDIPADDTGIDATDDTVDQDMAGKISALEAAYEACVAEQAKDPDGDTNPADQDVTKALTAMKTQLDALKTAQAADDAGDAAAAPAPKDVATNTPADKPTDKAPPSIAPAKKPGNLAIDNTTPKTNPVDKDGNVDDDAICANPDVTCGHMASGHADTGDGANSGACQMENCGCQSFVVDTGSIQTGDSPTDDGGGPNNSGGDDQAPATASMARKFADTPLTPEAVDTDGMPGDDQMSTPATPGAMNMGPAFTMVAIIEGAKTQDGRFINPDALTWLNPPWALMGLATSTHDPNGFDQNDPAVIVGRIDSYERQPGPNGTSQIVGKGFFLSNDDGSYFADLLDQMGRLPVSGDVSVGTTSETLVDGEDGAVDMLVTLAAGTLEATTILPFGPAFVDCYIVLGDNLEKPAIPQQTPEQAPMVASAYQIVHWMTDANCVPCGQADDVLVASAAPLRPPAAWFADPKFAEGDGRVMLCEGKTKYGQMTQFQACPITVTDDGEVFGHIAPWGICHIGIKGECVIAPHSKTDYAVFKRGQHVITAEGDKVRVGVLTANVGHASEFYDARKTMDHYDNSAAQVAYVNVFEDAFGIAVHGVIAADATAGQIQKLRASSPSGDWRDWGGNLELTAALCVNEPGFVQAPKAVMAGGRQLALVAAGAQEMDALTHPDGEEVDDDRTILLLAAGLVRRDAQARINDLNRDIAIDARRRIAELV